MKIAETRTRRVALLGLVALLALVAAFISIRVGATPLGAAAPNDQACLQAVSTANSDQPDYALLNRTHAMQTWLPLGLVCSVDATEPGTPAFVQRYQSWALTYSALSGLLIAALALALLLAQRQRQI